MKMFKNIMFAAALLAMNAVDAKQVGGTKARSTGVQSAGTGAQPSGAGVQSSGAGVQSSGAGVQDQGLTVQQRQEMLNRQKAELRAAQEQRLREQAGQGEAPQVAESVSSQEWEKIEDKLDEYIDAGKLHSALERIKKIKHTMKLTSEQKRSLKRTERTIRTMAQSALQLRQIEEKKKRKSRGWISDGVENYKNMIADKLDDVEKYPTLQSKKEALEWGMEFFEPGYTDVTTMNKAVRALMSELSSGSETQEQMKINRLINKMRDPFKFNVKDESFALLPNAEKINYFEDYLKNIKNNTTKFVANNITNDNVRALLKAIISETQRINTMIDSLSGKVLPKQPAVSPWQLGWRSIFGESTPETTSTTQPTTQPVQQVPVTGSQDISPREVGAPQGNPVGQ